MVRHGYVFVVKYKMQQLVGVEISHTSIIVCDSTDSAVKHGIEAFNKWCDTAWFGCWDPDQEMLWSKLNFMSTSCTEYYFGDDLGIRQSQFGRTEYYHKFTQKDRSSTTVYPVGDAALSNVAQALSDLTKCAPSEEGYVRDYNPATYHFLGHNCHGFVDMMLNYLALPYWSKSKHLPDSFMPEDKRKNPILARIVQKFLEMTVVEPLEPVRTSSKCK